MIYLGKIFNMIQKNVKILYSLFCFLSITLRASDARSDVDFNNSKFQEFLTFVVQQKDEKDGDIDQKYFCLRELARQQGKEQVAPELFNYAIEDLKVLHGAQLFHNRLSNEQISLEKYFKAIQTRDIKAIQKIEKERCKKAVKEFDEKDIIEKFSEMYPLSREVLQLGCYYQNVYDVLRIYSIADTISDCVLVFKFMNQVPFFKKHEEQSAQDMFLQNILDIFPCGACQHIARVKNLETLRLQELEEQKKSIAKKEAEKRQQELALAREVTRKNDLSYNLAKQNNLKHLATCCLPWIHNAQKKIKDKNEMFEHEVVEKNMNHRLFVERVQAQRDVILENQEDELEIQESNIEMVNLIDFLVDEQALQNKALIRQAKIERRQKKHPVKVWWRAHLQKNDKKYAPSDMIRTVKQRNAENMQKDVEKSCMQRFFAWWVISATKRLDEKKVIEQMHARQDALVGPRAWRHSPYGYKAIQDS